MKPGGRGRVYGGMTETLQDRLRHGAANIHSIGAGRAADLLKEAATRLEQQAAAENCVAFPIAKEVAEARANTETLRGMLVEARGLVDAGLVAHRAFLERAVCHPGPPASEHEDYDPEADIGELEAAVLERMDLEPKAERELQNIRKLCEEALGRTPDPARSTMQVVRELCAHHSAARTYRANMEDPPAGLEPHEMASPIVRREHFAGPFPAISGYVKRTAAARAATVGQALRMLKDGQRLAVHDEPERVDILFLDPGQEPPLGQEWTVYGPPHPKAAEFQKLVDDLRGKHAGALNSPETRARLQTEIAGFMAAQRDAPAPPNIDLDDERSDLPDGKIAFKVRVSPELAAAIERQLDEEAADRMRRAMTYRPGSPIPERAPADYHPAEYMTPEQEAACEEQRDRFDHDED